jgi:hypothetical protein
MVTNHPYTISPLHCQRQPKTAPPRREPQTHPEKIANKELRAHTTHHPRERTINNNIQTSNKYPLYTINTRRMSTGALDPRWTRDVNALTLPLQVTRSPVLHHSSEGRKRPNPAPSDLPPPPVGPLRRSRPCPCAAMMPRRPLTGPPPPKFDPRMKRLRTPPPHQTIPAPKD